MKLLRLFPAVLTGALLAGCAAGGAGAPPLSQPENPQSIGTLQFAVGTANIGQTGTVGLNTVETFRQSNGLSAALVNTPTITGPTGFLVPASAPSADASTNHISGAPQNINPLVANPSTTFGQSGGAFEYGFAPENIGNTGSASYSIYSQPFYGSTTIKYVGGPPAYPFFKDGTYPSSFAGYPQGFTMFNAAPVAGSYSLSVVVASSNVPSQTFTASGTLADTTPLAAQAAPTFTSDGVGGGTGTVTIPNDARVTETLVYFVNSSQGTYFTVGPLKGAPGSTVSFTLPDKLGPCSGTGCQTGANAAQTLVTGNKYSFYAASFDYSAFEAGPPGNSQQKPTITGANGQADITTSVSTPQTY